MKLSKKAQGEVAGLLVIVILLLFVGIIFLRFYLAAPATSVASSRLSLEASNVLTALQQVHIGDQSFRELAADCHTDTATCKTLEQDIERILSIVLREGQQYSLSLASGGDILLAIEHCGTGVASSYSFVADQTFYDVQLKLC